MTDEVVVDDFDKAFNEVVASMEAPPAAPPADPPAPAATPPADPPAPATPPATLPATPPVIPPSDPPADPPASVTPPVIPPTPPIAPPAAAPTPPAPPAPPPETPEAKTAREAFEATIKPYEPTTEEKAALEKFKVDFPGEYQAVEAQFKAQKQAFNAQVYEAVQGVLKQVAPRLASVEQNTTEAAVERHVAALHTAHADFDEVVPKVAEWIKTLPAYAQVGAQAVFDGGTTKEVIDLVNDFKKANNMTAPTPPAPPAPPAKPKVDGSDLTPVSSRRPVTTPKGQADPNDFDGAFAEAAAELG